MRKILNYKLLVLFALLLVYGCNTKHLPDSPQMDLNQLHYSYFINPPNEFRSHPFYSINDSLTEEEISRQIKDFKKAGFGGFYLHSRSGLITGFLEENWWKIMEASVDAANEVDLRCMFYDEDKWPSGFAGGIVPQMGEEYRSKCLARLDKKTPLPVGAEIINSDSLYNYVLYTMQFGWDIFNGTCYVDLFNPEVTQAFIDVSYKPYVEKYKAKINSYTPAIFSDEPHVHARYFDRKTPNLGTLSYSPWLEKKFKEMYAYDLRDKLPLLFEEKDNWREVRLQYYRAKALAFEESYTRQLSAFCAENGFQYTGHYLAEEVLEKVRDRAANTMLHYRSMQQPGMDMLGLSIESKLITGKNLSSVANQFGQVFRLSELFGISGQNMNFEDRKWLAGWHSVLGVNHFCPHLTLYSMRGHRKRDYPPTFSYQQPYWKYNKKLEDYLGRIAYASSIGEYAPQLLVISPLESEYIKGTTDRDFTEGILKTIEALQAAHYDYDIGDEQILADTAFVQENKLVVGQMSYEHIVLPDMISIRQSTLDLIQTLQKQGGKVFYTGQFPKYIDGVENEKLLAEFKTSTRWIPAENLDRNMPGYLQPNAHITGDNAEKIWSQTRVVKNGKLVQLYNSSHTKNIRFELKADFGNAVVLWLPSTATCFSLSENENGRYELELSPSSNCWITFGSLSNEARLSGEYKLPKPSETEVVLKNQWTGKRLAENAITLDFASYSTDKGKTYSAVEPVIGIFNRLADQNFSGELWLNYPFQVEHLPERCSLAIEQPEMYESISVNDMQINVDGNSFFIDRTFKSGTISTQLKKGKNNIITKLEFKAPESLSALPVHRYGTEIESMYLFGDFAVYGSDEAETFDTQRNRTGDFQMRPVYQFSDFAIATEKDSFTGNLTLEGYPFYAGSFELEQSFELSEVNPEKNYFVELPNTEAIAVCVEINGQVCDTLVWSPFKANVTNQVKSGENKIKITLVNSLRNLLGPHHHKGNELIKVGPNSFTGAGGFPDGRGESNWYDVRKTSSENAIWTDVYNHIPFGNLQNIIISSENKN